MFFVQKVSALEDLSLVVLFLSFVSSHFAVKFVTVTPTEASPWTVSVPSSLKGLLGSCVVIPCSYNYPDPQKEVKNFIGIWYNDEDRAIYRSGGSQIQNRAQLLGDVSEKNCSLMIDHLQQSDEGSFHFRIAIEGYDQFSYKNNEVSLSVISK